MISSGLCCLPSAALAVRACASRSSKEITCATCDGVSALSMSSRPLAQRCVKQGPTLGELVEHGLQLAWIDARRPRRCGAGFLSSCLLTCLLSILTVAIRNQRATRRSIIVSHAVRRHSCRLRGSGLPDVLDEALTLLAQDALNPADGITLAIEQVTNAAKQIHILRTIEAAAATALHRSDLVEAALPEPQHMLRNFELGGDLAYGAECVWCLIHVATPCALFDLLGLRIDSLLEDCGWLEHHHPARRYRHFLAGLWVASNPLTFVAHDERAERG